MSGDRVFNWYVDEESPEVDELFHRVVMSRWVQDESCCCGGCGEQVPLPLGEWWMESFSGRRNSDGNIVQVVDMRKLRLLENHRMVFDV